MKIEKPILVVGGGISGITAAVELADAGREVILLEKESYLGGNVVKMNNYFPKFCPPNCGLEINYRRIRSSRRVKVLVQTTVEKIEGFPGDFKVKLKTAPRYINDYCTACGKCAEICPVDRSNLFNYGFDKTKAAYLPHEMAFPMSYTIDGEACLKENCEKCLEVCDYDAIDLSAREVVEEVTVSHVIVATGWKSYDASLIANLNYSAENVVTNVEFERLLAANGPGGKELVRPSDNRLPERIAFVQCAGSRDENYLPYCSTVCCSASLKHALTVNDRYPDIRIKIFYIDLRVSGRNEDVLMKAQERKNISLIKGKVGTVSETDSGKNLFVEAEDVLSGRKLKEEFDLVVLATGIVPNETPFTISKNEYGFIESEQEEGITAASSCKRPMDVSASVKDATAAAIKAIRKL